VDNTGAKEGRHCRATLALRAAFGWLFAILVALLHGYVAGLCEAGLRMQGRLDIHPGLTEASHSSLSRVPFREFTRTLGIVSRIRLREPRADTAAPGGEGGF